MLRVRHLSRSQERWKPSLAGNEAFLRYFRTTANSGKELHVLPRPSVQLPASKYAPMQDTYDPKTVEQELYQWWEDTGVFDHNRGKGKTFSMVIPPPNVTGSLHIGHALTVTIQDCLIRWRRMQGDDAIWIPGLDHAGIATQSVVERNLEKTKGVTRHDLGRENFVDEVHRWNELYGGKICSQLRRLGASLNWDRQVFTLDDERSKAVEETFVRFSEKGLIYRGTRMVNWCPHLQTALSDIEVDLLHVPKPRTIKLPSKNGEARSADIGWIDTFCYPVVDAKGSLTFLEVSTTRLETMMGDTALAVHPQDERYKHLIGCVAVHPFRGKEIDLSKYSTKKLKEILYNRHDDSEVYTMPVVADEELVDPSVGTGVVKVTPAHEEEDFACAKRHNLSIRASHVINNQGVMNENCSQFRGLDRFVARDKIREVLDRKGLFLHREAHEMTVPVCSRSGDILEPMLKPQWFVKCDRLARRSLELVNDGKLSILPSNPYSTLWNQWLNNIHDWCISRQLWWGHRIPAYRVVLRNSATGDCSIPFASQNALEGNDGLWLVARSKKEALERAKREFDFQQLLEMFEEPISSADESSWSIDVEQDEDVLDTWFSSAIFPVSVFGFPSQHGSDEVSSEFRRYYPLSLMETGSDILFFWVARMVMLCYELTGQAPFQAVYLHPIVRDKKGQKMSKSLGNVIDPVSLMDGRTKEQLMSDIDENAGIQDSERRFAKKSLQSDFPNGIPECGTDALRLSLGSYLQQGIKINMDVDRAKSYRHFCNKIWNASKLIMDHAAGKPNRDIKSVSGDCLGIVSRPVNFPRESLTVVDRWVLSEFTRCCEEVEKALQTYEFATAVQSIHSFFLHSLCDVYIEWCKPTLGMPPSVAGESSPEASKDAEATNRVKAVQTYLLDGSLRLLHPFMPYLTEELWQRLKGLDTHIEEAYEKRIHPTSISTAAFPSHPILECQLSRKDEVADNEMNTLLSTLRGLRELKQTLREVCGSSPVCGTLHIFTKDPSEYNLIKHHISTMLQLPGMKDIQVNCNSHEDTENDTSASLRVRVSSSIQLKAFLDNSSNTKDGLIDNIELRRKRIRKLENEESRLLDRMQNEKYFNAPKGIIQRDQNYLKELQQRRDVEYAALTDLESALSRLSGG